MADVIATNKVMALEFIGGPLDGKTKDVPLGDVRVPGTGPFDYRLTIVPCSGPYPFKYAAILKKMLDETGGPK